MSNAIPINQFHTKPPHLNSAPATAKDCNHDRLSSRPHPGASWFFTLNLADRRQALLTEQIDLLRASFRKVMRQHPWRIDAIVILPDHLHAQCTLAFGDSDYAARWRLIKTGFSHVQPYGERISASRARRNEGGIWQRRYWEHRIRDQTDFNRHTDYMHHNPRKHGHVQCVADWSWSSCHRYVRAGLLPRDWAGNESLDRALSEHGER